MIKRFRVQNYKALRDVTLELTPIHVLIGPNDSGKTSILEAIAALCRSVDYPLNEAFTGLWNGRDLVWQGEPEAAISFDVLLEDDQENCTYYLSCYFTAINRSAEVGKESIRSTRQAVTYELPYKNGFSGICVAISLIRLAPEGSRALVRLVHNTLAGTHYYNWNPDLLALPVAPDLKRRFRMEPSGFGLALCLDDILGYDRDNFINLEKRFREIFPQIRSIKLIPEPAYRVPANSPEQIPLLETFSLTTPL